MVSPGFFRSTSFSMLRPALLPFFLFMWLALGLSSPVLAQMDTTETKSYEPRFRVYTYEGEQYMFGRLKGVDITANKPNRRQLKRGRRRLARYTRLQWNVHKVYPYAVKVSQVLEELDHEMKNLSESKDRKKYIKEKEKSLFGDYEEDVRKMTRSQGKLLVKLISRQTSRSTFSLIKETKSGAAAIFWQSIGLIFGINLKTDWNPEDDAMLEDIVRELDSGGYNIAYRQYNYSLR